MCCFVELGRLPLLLTYLMSPGVTHSVLKLLQGGSGALVSLKLLT